MVIDFKVIECVKVVLYLNNIFGFRNCLLFKWVIVLGGI